jgi:hypothetical protein
MKRTLDLNDALVAESQTLAAQQCISLARLIEEGLQLRVRLCKPARLPTSRGWGGLASGLDWTSNKAMLDAADQENPDP